MRGRLWKPALAGALALTACADTALADWSGPASLGAAPSDAVRGAIGPDGTAVVTWSNNGVVRVRVADRRGRFGPVQRLASRAGEMPIAAVAPDGRALVGWRQGRPRSLRVAVRPPGGRFGRGRTVTRHVGSVGTELAAAADRGGGFVLVFTRPTYNSGGDVLATSIDKRGRRGAVDNLGAGRFTWTFEQEQPLAVDTAGVAQLVLTKGRGSPMVARRPPNGRFAAPVPLGPSAPVAAFLRLGAGPDGDVAASWASTVEIGELGAFGSPTFALDAGGAFGSPVTGDTTAPERFFNPWVAPVGGGRVLLAWQRYEGPDPIGSVGSAGPVSVAPASATGAGPAREATASPVESATAQPLPGGRALLFWSERDGRLGARLVDRDGNVSPTAAPPGRERFADDAPYGTRVLYTAGGHALAAWKDVDGHLRASVGRF